MSSPDNGGGGGGGISSGSVQTNTITSGPNVGGDKTNPIIKQNAFPIDLAPKIALVKPTDGKGGPLQTHQFRTLTQQPMRVVMPSGAVQTTGTAQIIQTHLMPQAMIKQVDALGRTQITALPSRSMAQSSITVTRPLTPNTFMPRGVTTVTNISGARGTIRAQTPPISNVTNLSTGFVRSTIPPRTPSPAGTVIPSGTTWMAGNQPVHLIRASIGHSPRTRIVSQNIPSATASVSNAGITTISTNIVSSQSGQTSQVQTVSSGNNTGGGGQGPTFVATLAAVLPPRQQTATLVYSNPQQFGTTPGGQRLAVTNPISTQRQMRPIQIGNARLPANGLGVRVSNGNIIRGSNNIPVLAPSSVLTSLPAGTSTTVTASNLTAVTGLPNARIIQVQQQNPGGGAQVLSTSRITGNLMTLHPLVMNTSAGSASNVRGTATTAKPSLTITHVGKVATSVANNASSGNVQLTSTNLSQAATITASMPSSLSGHSHQSQQQQHTSTSTPIGIVMGTNANQSSGQHPPHQIAQIVNLNQPGINVGHGHQIQIIGSQQQSSTVVPLTITSRAANTSVSNASASQIVRANVNLVSTVSGASNHTNAILPPIAKVLPQQQQTHSNEPPPIVSVSAIGNTQNVYIHSRTVSNPSVAVNAQSSASIISTPAGTTYYMPVTSSMQSNSGGGSVVVSTATLQSITTNSSSVTTNVPLNTTLTASYAPQAGPFAVVPSSNRGPVTASSVNLISTSSSAQSNQSIPVRFNPPLIVDGNTHTIQGGTIISKHQHQSIGTQQQQQQQQQQHQVKQTHMLLPLSSAKTAGIVPSPRHQQTIVTTASRKRDQQSIPYVEIAPSALTKSAVKNLNPTLIAMGSESMSGIQNQRTHSPPISRPGSSDGSTTVSATSSPGIDQQEQEEMNALNAMHRNNRNIGDGAQFKNVDNLFATGQTVNVPQMQANNNASAFGQHSAPHIVGTSYVQTASSSATATATAAAVHIVQSAATIVAKSNGNADELTPRKRARKQQLSDYAGPQNTKKYQVSGSGTQTAESSTGGGSIDSDGNTFGGNGSNASSATIGHATPNKNTDASMKNVDFIIKKPRTCTLLDSYKQTWKATNNHFQRYSDVKPREDRRPTVMDLANQSHVLQKVNGWKIYHLSSQMEDLTELESQVYDKLASMLQCMEAHNQSSDVDRVNDLIKGNMQRTKIVSDSINEARAQILKVFDHKSHVSDIIHRCASKRNFKKREKS